MGQPGIVIRIDNMSIDTVNFASRPPGFRWHIGPTVRKGGEVVAIEISATIEQQTRVHLHPLTHEGHDAELDGPATWELISGTCRMEPIDAASAWVMGDEAGDSVVKVSGDADLGDGVQTITDMLIVHILHPMAERLGMAADTPVFRDAIPAPVPEPPNTPPSV